MDVTSLPRRAQPSNRWALPGECQRFGWAARCQRSCSGAHPHPLTRTHIPQSPTSVLPTPLEPQQRRTLPESRRCSLSLGTHLPRPPRSSWHRSAVPSLAELWTPGQTDSPSPWVPLWVAVLRLWGHGLVLGCQGSRERGPCDKEQNGSTKEQGAACAEHSVPPAVCPVLCTLHPVAPSAHPALSALHPAPLVNSAPCTQHHS